MQTAFIKQDVYSVYGKPARKYASRNERVVVVSDHGEVLIVEKEDGERIPVRTTDVILN